MKRHRDIVDAAVEQLRLPPGASIVVAVSGGPDSVALLDALRRISPTDGRRWRLRVVHVDHQLRGEESDADAEFVLRLAKHWDLDAEVIAVDTIAFARSRHLSLEDAARRLRYTALRRVLNVWPGDVIATGHTLDDQAETVMLRLLRGAGIAGLGGMKTQTDDIVRPFLQVPRDAILESIQSRGLGFRTDSSNQDPRFDRNRLRQVVMPALERYRPGSARILARIATVAQADAELIADSTDQALSLMRGDESRSGRASHSVWKVLHPSLRRQIVRALSAPFLDNPLDTEHVELLCRYLEAGRSPPPGQMPGGLTVQIEDGDIVVRQGETQPSPSAFEEELSVPGLVVSPGGELRAEILSRPAEDDLCRWLTVLGPLHALCDSATIGDRLVVRRRRPGDRLTPLGMSGTRKLQDILVDRHVPRVRRDELPVVVAAGRIIWVPGVVQAAHSAVSPSSDRLLHLVFAPAGGRAPW